MAACDYVGESIASFLGITTPKYSYEIEQFKKIQEEQAKAADEEKRVGGWMQNAAAGQEATNADCITTQQQSAQRF